MDNCRIWIEGPVPATKDQSLEDHALILIINFLIVFSFLIWTIALNFFPSFKSLLRIKV